MAQRESRRSRKIMDELKLHGAFCFKVWGSEHMMAGLPDIIGCYRGRFFGLEVKEPDKRNNTSARQDYVIGLIRKAGGIAQVVVTPEEALGALGIDDDE
jgi:Holliday junction resolvase